MISTILVTDDNVLDNAILRNYLYKERVNIVSALNGREALDMVESRNVDIIILDMVMPVLDGQGFLEEFSKTTYYKEIPIIVASGVENDELEKIFHYDIYDFILKPLNHTNKFVLINKIRKALQFRKMLLELKKQDITLDSIK
ncbi:response regulator [Ruminiclostridium cellobioparum]|uniref:Stage 0 sporulation protein A homolog n=1 Tax=Ruminiclostridium cellobioparum subsp. termitidis CT1112 TaxID=1195236 RepID=S0FHZ7_RUMCE|nr:response regulator [Ruminiclostridium cellobioparum]EMS71187.1 response regulator receiver protein [Ruminiclostridium cellobioparum subsp. termitidis CT1112]